MSRRIKLPTRDNLSEEMKRYLNEALPKEAFLEECDKAKMLTTSDLKIDKNPSLLDYNDTGLIRQYIYKNYIFEQVIDGSAVCIRIYNSNKEQIFTSYNFEEPFLTIEAIKYFMNKIIEFKQNIEEDYKKDYQKEIKDKMVEL